MKLNKEMLLLYLVTDRKWIGTKKLSEQIEEALAGGVTCVQLREKELSDDKLLKEAFEIKGLCRKYNVPFIVNDNIELALECDADGVHIGQNDMEPEEVRLMIGKEKIMGVSVQTEEQAKSAQEKGADYLGAGAMFQTSTKPDANSVSIETLQSICDSVSIPVVAIGGIKPENIRVLYDSGIEGIAVVSAVLSSSDIKKSTRELLIMVESIKKDEGGSYEESTYDSRI